MLPVEVEGPASDELPPELRAVARRAIIETFDGRGEIAALDAATIDEALEGCDDDDCTQALSETLDADFVVRTRIEMGDRELSAALSVVGGEPERSLGPFEQQCPICGRNDLEPTVRVAATDALVAILRTRVETPERPPPRRTVSAPFVAGLVSVGAGSAATVGGITLLSLHHRNAGCEEHPRFSECLPLRYDTAAAGGTLLGIGLAAVAVGVTLLVVDRRSKRKRARPTVAITPRGASLGIRF